MKKIKLFLAAVAAMVSLGVQAGSDWVAPSAPSAADPVSGGVYKIRNVGAGQYLSGGAAWFSWATSAVLADVNSALEWTITGSETEGYTFACNRSGNNKLFTSGNNNPEQCMHVDGGSATTYFLEKDATTGFYRLRQSGVEGKYVGAPDAKNGVLAQVDPANPSVSTISCDWEFVPTSSLVTYGPTITYAETRAKVLAYANATDIYTDQNDAKATLVNGVYAQDDVVDAATTAEQVNNAIATIKALVVPFVKTVKINDGKSFDVSEFLLTNPSFETGNLNGWTNSGMGAQANNSFAKTGSYYAESWQPNGTKSLSQTLQALPAGYYTLSADIKARGVTSAKLYAGSTPEVYMTIGDFVNTYSVTFSCEENANVTIGFEGVGTGAGASWLALDNFTLKYLGIAPLVLFQNELADAVAAARTHATTLSVPAAALTAYNNAINAAEANKATVEACQNGVAAIEAATATVDALASNYTRYQNIKSAAQAIAANLDVTAADAEVAAATTNEAIDAAVATLRAAFLEKLPNVTVPEAGLDVTAVMVDNASVSQNTDYWTAVGTPNTSYSWAVCNYGECEFYQQNFKFYQTLALNPGTWEFGVTGFHRAGNHSTYFYAGDVDKKLIPGVANTVVNSMAQAKDYFDGGNGKVALKFLVEEAGNIEIGIDNQDTETDKWTIFRNFTLKYFGAPDYTVYDEQLAAAVAAAKAVEGNVPAAVYTTLDGVVTENNKTYTKKADYVAAIAAIESATTTAKTVESAYAAYKLDKAAAEALAAVANDNSEANGVFVAAISSAATDAEAATTVEAINAAAASLKPAMTTYVFAANPVGDGAKFDLTFLLTNPNLEGLPTWTGAAGWYTDQQDGNSQVMTNDNATSEDGTKKAFYEYYSNPAKTNNLFALYQKVTLAEGTYNMTCYAFAQNDGTHVNHPNGVYFYANDVQGSAVNNARLSLQSIEFVNGSTQEVKIGLKTVTGNANFWMGIGYVELYKVPAKVVTIDEAVNYVAESAAAKVILNRTIKADTWNTIVLPFQLNEAELKAAFGDDVQIAEFSDAGDSEADVTVNFNVMATPAIAPNKPVLLKTSTDGTEYTFEGRTIAVGEAKVAGTYVDFVGTYAASTTIAEGNYFISANKLYKSEGGTTIKGTRAYIDARNVDSGEVKMFIDGIATGISEINGVAAEEQGAIYNLAGQRVAKAQKGVFIVNGKKVVVK